MKIIPELWPTLISAIIFLINLFIIKKLYVGPYLSLNEKRHELTEGLKEKAETMQAQAVQSMDALEKKLKEVSAETKVFTDEKRKLAQEQANDLVNETKQKAVQDIKAARENVKKLLVAEKAKILEKTTPLVEGVYKNVMNI